MYKSTPKEINNYGHSMLGTDEDYNLIDL